MTDLKRKKTIISIVTIFIFSLFLSASFAGTEASENTVTIQTVSGEPGQTVSVDVTASDIDMAGFTLTVNYDPEYLEPTDAVLYIGEGSLTEHLDFAEDKMKFHWSVAENVTVNQMFKIEFEVIKEISGTTGLNIDPENNDNEVLQVIGGVPTEIEVTYVDGGVSNNGDPEEECYIATAVYGSYHAPEVVTLRTFRDDVLKNSLPGRLFIKAYYALSPPVADYLVEVETLNTWVRNLLDGFLVLINSSSEE